MGSLGRKMRRSQSQDVEETIKTKKLALVDGKGRVRALLHIQSDGKGSETPHFSLFDEGGKSRIALSLAEHGPGLVLGDGNRPARAILHLDDGRPALLIRDGEGRVTAQFYFDGEKRELRIQTPEPGEGSEG